MSGLNSIPVEDLRDAWINLAAHGTPPASEIAGRVLPAWSVGLEAWLDRLTSAFLRDYCRRNSHFKLAVAPYGGGKTHFLLALAERATRENWATCYLQCKANVTLGDWFGLYEHIAKSVQLPRSSRRGLKPLAQAALEAMQQRASAAPDPGFALDEMIVALEDESWPHNSFPRVMGVLLNHLRDPRAKPEIGDAAMRWLQGQPESLTPKERQTLRLQPVRTGERSEHGRTLFYSLVRFISKANVHGLALLLDEMDVVFNARGKAREKILVSMRILLDAPDDRMNRIPLFGIFAADPTIPREIITTYQALATRFQVLVPFHQGDDNTPQIDLGELGKQTEVLQSMGQKLLDVGMKVHGWNFDRKLQERNLRALADVTAERILEINARRLYVKAWCGVLEEQSRVGERPYSKAALSELIQGVYEWFRRADEAPSQGDVG